MNKNIKITIILALVVLFVFAGWQIYKNQDNGTSNESFNSENETSQNEVVEINIQNFAFSPKTIIIQKGTNVVWTNFDSIGHTATSDDGLFNSGILSEGESWNYTFEEEGSYGYYCIPHPNMKGTIVVE
jgi:plastocyanin